MKRPFEFTKMVASGNDFVVIEDSRQLSAVSCQGLVKKICDRKFGAGADGVLYLGKSKKADVLMRIFNADGSEAEMCGNGARCAALYISQRSTVNGPRKISIETKAGIIESLVNGVNVRIKLTEPTDLRPHIKLVLNGRSFHAGFVNTGVPHTVVFTDNVDNADVRGLGRLLRFHKHFSPAGTNADFVEAVSDAYIKVRTYERGVEDETLACGTGSAASALITALRLERNGRFCIKVETRSKEVLAVYFNKQGKIFDDIWLEGAASAVYKGSYLI